MRRRGWHRVAGRAVPVAAAVLGGCPAPDLYDPMDHQVPVTGFGIEATTTADGVAPSLEVVAHAYGYGQWNGRSFVRYLEAGEVRLAGRRAERVNIRPGEPQYVVEARVDEAPGRLAVEVAGRGTVPACSLEVRLPTADLPAPGSAVWRDRDLAIPVAFTADSLPAADQVVASIWFRTGQRADRPADATFTRHQIRGAVVVPAGVLAALPAGGAELVLRLEWRQPARETEVPCAPYLTVTASYGGRRGVVLR